MSIANHNIMILLLFFDSNMKRKYGLLDYNCGPHPRILFLHRYYRRAANMADMVNATRQLGLNNTIIEMVKFEKMTIFEQLKKVLFDIMK